jgi:hypothetical protein
MSGETALDARPRCSALNRWTVPSTWVMTPAHRDAANDSWWVELRSRGEVPGLRMLEPPAEEDIVPSTRAPGVGSATCSPLTRPTSDQGEYGEGEGQRSYLRIGSNQT